MSRKAQVRLILLNTKYDRVLEAAFAAEPTLRLVNDKDGWMYQYRSLTSAHYQTQQEAVIEFLVSDEPKWAEDKPKR